MQIRQTRIFQVDAFTSRPFAGNPAGVCLLDQRRDEAWMQAVASEMNLSETAFLLREGSAHRLRWFTPEIEVPLCGHATLASAHVLWETGALEPEAEAVFHTHSGVLAARRGDGGWIELDFPALFERPAEAPEAVLSAFRVEPTYVGMIGRPEMWEDNYLLELGSEAAVRAARPDLSSLRAPDAPAVLLTARGDSGEHDFVSRYFAPGAGIDEDPVTGAAHCILAPFWSKRLGKDEMLGYQASRRGGTVGVRLAGERVKLRGRAVTVLEGSLRV